MNRARRLFLHVYLNTDGRARSHVQLWTFASISGNTDESRSIGKRQKYLCFGVYAPCQGILSQIRGSQSAVDSAAVRLVPVSNIDIYLRIEIRIRIIFCMSFQGPSKNSTNRSVRGPIFILHMMSAKYLMFRGVNWIVF